MPASSARPTYSLAETMMTHFLRNSALRLLAAFLATVFVATTALTQSFAQSGPLQIDITKGNRDPLPIAVPGFGGDTQLGTQIAQVINENVNA